MALTVIYTLSTLKSEHGLNPNMDFSYKRNYIGNLTIMQPIFIISSFIYLHGVIYCHYRFDL